MRVYLVRHGQTTWNALRKAHGATDVPLDDDGLAQAAAAGRRFEGEKIDRILSSDLERAAITAQEIGARCGVQPTLDPNLRERSLGAWEGLGFDDLHERFRVESAAQKVEQYQLRPPSGESLVDVGDRIAPIVRDLIASKGATIVVSHGGVLAVMLAALIDAEVSVCRAFRFGNTSVTLLQSREDGPLSLYVYNDTSHLVGAPAAAHGPNV